MTRITKMTEECFPTIMGINPVQGPFLLTTRAGRLSMEAQTKAIKHSPGRCSVLLSLLQALRVKTGVCACVHVCVCGRSWGWFSRSWPGLPSGAGAFHAQPTSPSRPNPLMSSVIGCAIDPSDPPPLAANPCMGHARLAGSSSKG